MWLKINNEDIQIIKLVFILIVFVIFQWHHKTSGLFNAKCYL